MSHSANRLASGSRITRAADDAAGIAVASNLGTQARSLRQAIRNANDGISILAVNEAAGRTFANTFERMRELAVQSASETLDNPERRFLATEFSALVDDLKDIVLTTKFNDQSVTSGAEFAVQVGVQGDSSSQITISGANLKQAQTIVSVADIGTVGRAKTALGAMDKGLAVLSSGLANLGADMNRLTAAISNAQEHHMALEAAKGRILDTNMAMEAATAAALQVKNQAGTAAMAQANNIARPVIGLI